TAAETEAVILDALAKKSEEIAASVRIAAEEEKKYADAVGAGGAMSVDVAVAVGEAFRAIPPTFREISAAAGLSIAETQSAWSTFSSWFGAQLVTVQDLSKQTWAS